ncbi:MAG: hypothetical protein ACKOAV_01695, partial [Bacteroidota bacterium]
MDTLRPILSVNNPVNLVLGANGLVSLSMGQVNRGSTDNCGIVSMTLSDTLFGCTELGLNQVEFRVLDASGNQSSMTINVNVTDETSPAVTVLPNLVVYLNGQGQGMLQTSTSIQATDNCSIDSILPLVWNFGCADVQLTGVTRTVTVRDASGNETTVSANIMVMDTLTPVVQPLERTVYLGSNGTVTIMSSELVSATDNCCLLPTNPAS